MFESTTDDEMELECAECGQFAGFGIGGWSAATDGNPRFLCDSCLDASMPRPRCDATGAQLDAEPTLPYTDSNII